MLKAHLKGYTNYLGEPLNLVAENQNINFRFTTLDGRTLNTADLYFTAEEKQEQGQKVLWLKAALNPAQYIAFRYALDENDFMLDFAIRSQGLQAIINQNISQEFGWELQAFRNSRSIEYENRYTELVYGYEDEKVNELSIAGEDEEVIDEVQWIGYKQHFFNSILIPAQPLNQVALTSKSLVDDEALEQKFTKKYSSAFALQSQGELNHGFRWYFGPSEYKTLAQYELGIEKNINFGWGIFGWINKSVFIRCLVSLVLSAFGIAIIIMTIIVLMSPVTYKSYVSQIG